MFSGEEETAELIANGAEIGFVMLIVLGLAKLIATSLVLATGWKGGYIFPIMFTCVALGLSLIHISQPTRLRRSSYAVFCL